MASPEVNDSQQQAPQNVYHDIGVTRNKIVTAQFECYQKIMKDNYLLKKGKEFNRKQWRKLFRSAVNHPSVSPTDGHESAVPGSDWPRALPHLPLHLPRHILPLQESELSEDHSPQKPLLLLRPELHHHHHLADGRRKQPGVSAAKPRFPLIPATIHAIARSYYYNDKDVGVACRCASAAVSVSLQVNLFFLLNIVRVLITKLKVTHQAESSLYMKAVRATLILVPLLGIQYVLLPYKPGGRVSSEIYDYVMNILMHYQ
ncbi:unnamed protein product, partial [Cylicocyclus nassatus]